MIEKTCNVTSYVPMECSRVKPGEGEQCDCCGTCEHAHECSLWLRCQECQSIRKAAMVANETDVQTCHNCKTTREVNSFGLCQECSDEFSAFVEEQERRRQEANET